MRGDLNPTATGAAFEPVAAAAARLPGWVLEVAQDPVRCASQCGPLTYLFAKQLRAAGVDCGMLFVVGAPPVHPQNPNAVNVAAFGSAHYLLTIPDTSGATTVVDVSYRQFDPATPWPLTYPCLMAELEAFGWDDIEGVVAPGDPLEEFSFAYSPDVPAERELASRLRALAGLPHLDAPDPKRRRRWARTQLGWAPRR